MIKTYWQYNTDTEIYRIVFSAGNVYKKFYQELRFLVLPFLPHKDKRRSVYIPFLDVFNNQKFWKVIKKYSKHNFTKGPFNIPEKTKTLLKSELEQFDRIPQTRIDELRSEWQSIKKAFFKDLQYIFDYKEYNIKTIEIRPTLFGTKSSYSPPNKTGKLFIYTRIDCGTENIGEMITSIIISYILRLPYDIRTGIEWIKKENLCDFILKHSRLSRYFPKFRPTLEVLEEIYNARLIQKSKKYFAKLGFPIESFLAIKNNRVFNKQNEQYLFGLSTMQGKILKYLISKRNQICTFDELATILWEKKASERFSLYAISKIIQRIRECLKQNDIISEIIHTQRGRGYVLYD